MKDRKKIETQQAITCPDCGREFLSGNFCTGCGKKMVVVCNCWQVNHFFNCGHDKCPTIGDLVKEFGKSLFPS